MTEHGQNSMQLLNKLFTIKNIYGGLSLADCPPKIKLELGKK